MKKSILLSVATLVLVAFVCLPLSTKSPAAAVAPVMLPEQEFYKTLELPGSGDNEIRKRPRAELPQAVIEGIRRSASKSKKMFRATQFICILPIESSSTLTTTIHDPSEAVAAVKMLKEEGVDEIRLRSPISQDMLNAIVKTAREQDIRINV